MNEKLQLPDGHISVCRASETQIRQSKQISNTRLENRIKLVQLFPPVFFFQFYFKDHSGNNKTLIIVSLCSEHSMSETLSVALRVAEEAIDEAISKAEFDTASQVIYVVHTL